MSGRQVWLFKAGCWAALVTAAVHLIGHLSGPPPPANDTERELFRLYESYRFALPGGATRTLADFMRGFSLLFAVFFATLGGVSLLVVRRCARDGPLMAMLMRLVLASCVTALAISLTHFFVVPTLMIAVVAVCFTAALLGR